MSAGSRFTEVREYNEARPHQGRWCFGKNPMQTLLDALPMTNPARSRLGKNKKFETPARRMI
jgi:hypothetical protein